MVCVDITGVPAEGSECDVVVSLSAQDGPKASKFIMYYSIMYYYGILLHIQHVCNYAR